MSGRPINVYRVNFFLLSSQIVPSHYRTTPLSQLPLHTTAIITLVNIAVSLSIRNDLDIAVVTIGEPIILSAIRCCRRFCYQERRQGVLFCKCFLLFRSHPLAASAEITAYNLTHGSFRGSGDVLAESLVGCRNMVRSCTKHISITDPK